MTKVLHVLNELKPSGAETMLKVASPHFAALGSDSHVVSVDRSLGGYACDLQASGYRVDHFPLTKNLSSIFKFWKFLREQKFEAIHIHSEGKRLPVGVVARIAGIRRLIATVHNVFPYQGQRRIFQIISRAFLRFVGVNFVSIGSSVKENEEVWLHNPTQTIANWYDDTVYSVPTWERVVQLRGKFNIGKDAKVIVSVGNCSEIKNHCLLIEALHNLNQVYSNWLYLHAGTGQCEEEEKTLSQELGISDRCRFLGKVDNVSDILAVADVYVMPSLKEGASIAVLEALASGTPAVLTDVPGLRDVREYAPNVLFSTLDSDQLARRIKEVIDGEIEFDMDSTVETVKNNFSPKVGAELYYNLYIS